MGRSFAGVEWKAEASAGKHTQMERRQAGQGPCLSVLPMEVVGSATFNVCLSDAVRNSALDDQVIAERIHISPGYMSRFLRGVGQVWAKRLIAFMRVTNSLGPLQWIADQMGCDITVRHVVSAELAAARSRVAELERGGRCAV